MFFKKKEKVQFTDGLVNFVNGMANQRNALYTNKIGYSPRILNTELANIYKNGMYKRIINIKVENALENAFCFEDKRHNEIYTSYLEKSIFEACDYMVGFGRGVILLCDNDEDLSIERNRPYNPETVRMTVFDPSVVNVGEVETNIIKQRFNKPLTYWINGYNVHYSRVIDFTYIKPIFNEMSNYDYGGISEAQFIYDQIKVNGIVERANSSIIERASTFVYKVANFKSSLRMNQEADIIKYFSMIEDARSIYGALIVDNEDIIETHQQALSGMKDIAENSLRNLAFVTGIPMPMLIGENVQGLNSSGDTEKDCFARTIRNLKNNYIIDPVNDLMSKLDLPKVLDKESSELSAMEQATYEKTVTETAQMLYSMGADHYSYLQKKGVISDEEYEELKIKADNEEEIQAAELLNNEATDN